MFEADAHLTCRLRNATHAIRYATQAMHIKKSFHSISGRNYLMSTIIAFGTRKFLFTDKEKFRVFLGALTFGLEARYEMLYPPLRKSIPVAASIPKILTEQYGISEEVNSTTTTSLSVINYVLQHTCTLHSPPPSTDIPQCLQHTTWALWLCRTIGSCGTGPTKQRSVPQRSCSGCIYRHV